MFELTFSPISANVEKLDEELKERPGLLISGITYQEASQQVTVHFYEAPTGEQSAAVEEILQLHDPNSKSVHQRAEDELRSLRHLFADNPLEMDLYGELNTPLRELAERVAWLEKEFRMRQ